MRSECVAVLDIRSYNVTFLIGAKGVNGTFVVYDSESENYDGYYAGGFDDKSSFKRAVATVVSSVRQNYEGVVDEIYVGVPAAFIKIHTKGHTISFPSKRKISATDVDMLFESGLNELMASGRCIRRSGMYFSLADNRKCFQETDVYGVSSASLKGALSYYFIEENFYQDVMEILRDLGIEQAKFLPNTLAQSLYLFPQKRREGYAVLLDVGHVNSSISVVYGNGIVHEQAFDFGVGNILCSLMEQFNVDYAKAEEILLGANVSGEVGKGEEWTGKDDDKYSVWQINDVIKCALDELCEQLEEFFNTYYQNKQNDLFSGAIAITGEGAGSIIGLDKHVTNRINRFTQIVYPELPYYDKPMFSSRMALLEMALNDCKKQSLLYRIFNFFGGRKK